MMTRCHSRLLLLGLTVLLSVSAGCEVFTSRLLDFPNAETGEEGQIYLLDDLRDIATDPDMTEEEKREAYAALGIEDEDLLAALLTLTETE